MTTYKVTIELTIHASDETQARDDAEQIIYEGSIVEDADVYYAVTDVSQVQ